MEIKPKVSIIMSVYNGEKYLKEAIDSILEQTYKDFEFIIINDGSVDKSLKIIQQYNDNRIKIINNDGNKGLIYSLNKGIEYSKGEYIVRMDADDISLKNRLEKQVEFMELNKDVVLLGGAISMFKNNNILIRSKYKYPLIDKSIRSKMFFSNPFAHPTVIYRKCIIDRYGLKYNKEHIGEEDYGLWIELSKYGEVRNLKNVILKYRMLSSSITSITNKNNEKRFYMFKKIHLSTLEKFKIYEENEIRLIFEIINSDYLISKYTFREKIEMIDNLIKKNNELKIYDSNEFQKECIFRSRKLINGNCSYIFYKKSNVGKLDNLNIFGYIKILIVNKIRKSIKKKVR